MRTIDLRSDTVTLPTPEMREAMYRAEVGDDVSREDPTINRLEEMAAEMLGKQAALFTVSGTMGNLVSILTHCQRGDELIVGDKTHIFLNEVGGSAALGGVHVRTVANDDYGRISPNDLEAAIRTDNIHFPRTGLICLENTHNRCGGSVLTPEDTSTITEIGRKYGVPVHIDGARIFNAAVFLGISASELVKDVDSMSFCLSKGLSAPVGSVLVGSTVFIDKARKYRKMVGGGMRQAGVIAAAGIVALQGMIERLSVDHQNARLLAEKLEEVPNIRLDQTDVQTNIVYFQVAGITAQELQKRLQENGVRVSVASSTRIRMVTHYGIEKSDIEESVGIISEVCRGI